MKKNAKKRLLAICCVIVVACSVLLGAAQEAPVEEEVEEFERQIVVNTANPTIGSISVTGEFIGKVEPNQQVSVYPKLGGEVLIANYNVGDYVEAGSVLMQVDTTSLEFTIAQTQAALSNAEAAAALNQEMAEHDLELYYEGIEDGTNSQLLAAEAQVLAAEAQLEQANASLRAARSSYRRAVSDYSDMYTDPQVDSLRTGVTQAEQAVEAAQIQLETANASLLAVQSAVGNLESAYDYAIRGAEITGNFSDQYVALASLQNNLNDATLRAPISGIIEARNVDPFDMASAGAPAYIISNKETMSISFQIPENTYAHVRIGDAVQVEKNGVMYNGTIYEISTMVDATGQFTVKASVANPPSDLYTGASVRVFAQSQKADNVVVIPLDALYYDNGVPFVYVEQNSVAHRREVQVGIYDAETVQIISGLDLNDNVITTWHSSLKDGVEIVVTGGSGSPSAASANETTTEIADDEDEDADETGLIQSASDDDESESDADLLDTEEVDAA